MVEELDSPDDSFYGFIARSPLFRAGLVFNLFCFIGVVFAMLFLLSEGTLLDTIYANDFRVFYEAGQAFLNSPDSIYSVSPNGLPFRYLPSFAAFFAVFSLIPFFPLYLANITFMFTVNLGIVFVVYHICREKGILESTKNFEKTLTILVITPPHIVNLDLGQITQFAILLVLISLYLLHSSSKMPYRFFLVGLALGCAVILKPFFIVVLPFIIPIYTGGKFGIRASPKEVFGSVLGFWATMAPNGFYFLAYPSTLLEFIQVNFVDVLSSAHSTSLTRMFQALLPSIDSNLVQIVVMGSVGGLIFLWSYIRFLRSSEKNYTHHFAEMIFLVVLIYPDSWFLFIAVLYAFLVPSMLDLYSNIPESETRCLDVLWSGSNNLLAFFSIGIAVHYLVLGFDPIIPIWLLVMYFLHQMNLDKYISKGN